MSKLVRLTRALGEARLALKKAKAALRETELPLTDSLGHSAGTHEQHEARFEALTVQEAAYAQVREAHIELEAFAEQFAAQPTVLERRVQYQPGFDKRQDPGKGGLDRGIGGGSLWFTVVGLLGAVTLELDTGWFPPTVEERYRHPFLDKYPIVRHVTTHAPVPPGTRKAAECEYVDLGYCLPETRYWGHTETLRDLLLKEGSEALWQRLEQDYRERFEGAAPTVAKTEEN